MHPLCQTAPGIRGSIRGKICGFFVYLFGQGAVAHDEFNGARKVSPVDQGSMTQGFMTDRFDRLRRTAAPLMTSLRAMLDASLLGTSLLGTSLLGTSLLGTSLLGTGLALAGDDASRWDGDVRSAVRLIAGAPAAGKN